ncbi:Acetolactate synthase small subunit [Thermococcus sp. 2319x1]|uniref:ACT domain-containing protein n=1 Tax=Thermococcus sp. 2319x1 TaxID=1674923 RepID=UPI00073A76A6|nr:ACT domain-containing protein [Thermococcus sp. 2319x1]ALV62890.1 Acetolactate synthase small subunit [Thermococcus sp. 2319x1]
MRHYEILRIKENGKIEIPLEWAYEVGLVRGAYFLVEIDTDLNEIHLERIALPGKELVEIELIVKDKPGVLAKITGTLGKHRVNILFSEAEEMEQIGLGAIVAVVDVSQMDISREELIAELQNIEEVMEVSLKEIE